MKFTINYNIKFYSDGVAHAYADVIASKHPEAVRPPGISLSVNDTATIHFYHRFAMHLPTNVDAVMQTLGWYRTDIDGLFPSELAVLFFATRQHGHTWEQLEGDLRGLSGILQSTSSTIVNQGRQIIESLQNLPSMIWSPVDDVLLTDADKDVIIKIAPWLDEMRDRVRLNLFRTQNVQNNIRRFRQTLITSLEPDVARRIRILDESVDFDAALDNLSRRIDQLKADLERYRSEYQRYLRMIFEGAPGGRVGLAITASIFGSLAAMTRRDINRTLGEIDILNRQVAEKLKAKSTLERCRRFFVEMGLRFQDAEASISQYEFVGADIEIRLAESKSRLLNLNSTMMVIAFLRDFTPVVDAWVHVGDTALELEEILTEGRALFNHYANMGFDNLPEQILLQ